MEQGQRFEVHFNLVNTRSKLVPSILSHGSSSHSYITVPEILSLDFT